MARKADPPDTTAETPPAADAGQDPPELAERVDRLDSKVDKLIELVSGKEGQAQQAAQHGREAELDAPTSVAEQIRAQLEERDRKAAEAAGKKAEQDRVAALETRVSEMAEQPPSTPVRRVERFMWGHR